MPSTSLPLTVPDPLNVPGFWVSNSIVYRFRHDRGCIVLHLSGATSEPVVAVRSADPTQRREMDVLVHSPEVLGDLAVAVLSCAAIFAKHSGPRRTRDIDVTQPVANTDGGSGWGSNPRYLVDSRPHRAGEAWPGPSSETKCGGCPLGDTCIPSVPSSGFRTCGRHGSWSPMKLWSTSKTMDPGLHFGFTMNIVTIRGA